MNIILMMIVLTKIKKKYIYFYYIDNFCFYCPKVGSSHSEAIHWNIDIINHLVIVPTLAIPNNGVSFRFYNERDILLILNYTIYYIYYRFYNERDILLIL